MYVCMYVFKVCMHEAINAYVIVCIVWMHKTIMPYVYIYIYIYIYIYMACMACIVWMHKAMTCTLGPGVNASRFCLVV